jgi:hypothetical protein
MLQRCYPNCKTVQILPIRCVIKVRCIPIESAVATNDVIYKISVTKHPLVVIPRQSILAPTL